MKQQQANMDALLKATGEERLNGWKAAYSKRRVTGDALTSMANQYEAVLQESRAFSLSRHDIKPNKTFPQRERITLGGYFMEPVALGQGWLGEGATPYVEQAAMLRSCRAEFRQKKATFGLGTGCVLLTQHVLERIYERTEVSHSELADLIHRELDDLLRGLALAEASGLWLHRADGGGTYRVTAVPYAKGLLLANTRILFGDSAEGDFGFRLEIPTGRTQTPFLNPANVLEDLGVIPVSSSFQPILVTCGLTYLNLTTLHDIQMDYYYAFEALKEDVGLPSLNALSYLNFAPRLPHEPRDSYELNERFTARLTKLKALFGAGWMKPLETRPICYLLPYDHQLPR